MTELDKAISTILSFADRPGEPLTVILDKAESILSEMIIAAQARCEEASGDDITAAEKEEHDLEDVGSHILDAIEILRGME